MGLWIDVEVSRLKPWAGAIKQACDEADPRFPGCGKEDPFIMAGILLRETGAGYSPGYGPKGSLDGTGDLGHAVTPWQFDLRYHDNDKWYHGDPEARTMLGQARRAVMYIRENRALLFGAVPVQLLHRSAVAAYNSKVRSVMRCAQAGNPDAPTTNHDYSAWVFNKAEALRAHSPDLFAVNAA